MMTPSPKSLFSNPVHCLAFGFGAGLSPRAPGTVGTLVAIPLHILILEMAVNLYVYAGLVVAAFVLGIYLCGKTARDLGVHDHGGIVWDEFVGYWITMFLVPLTWTWVLAGFVAFRFFEALPPAPAPSPSCSYSFRSSSVMPSSSSEGRSGRS